MKTVITKSQFAEMKGRAPSAISNWIADGKITSAALVGKGVRAKIWLEQAERDLAGNLDPSQQISQDKPATFSVAHQDLSSSLSVEDEDLRRRRKADADSAEHQAELYRLKRERESGQWLEVYKAQQAWSRELSELITGIEIFITQKLPRHIADKHNLDQRQLAVMMRDLWREHRNLVADDADERSHTKEGE